MACSALACLLVNVPVFFVMPEGSDKVSGGNLYNAHLYEALEPLCNLQRLTPSELRTSRADGLYIVDTLNIDDFLARDELASKDDDSASNGAQHFVLLVHHLASIEPGTEGSAPEVVRETEALRRFDAFITTSAFASSLLDSYGLEQPTICFEPPISVEVDARSFDAPMRALMVCNLIPRKGVVRFLESLSIAARHDDDFLLSIVGRDDMAPCYAKACRLLCDELGQRVHLLGARGYSEMSELYQTSNLFVSASLMETFGIALQEAKHHGLPIFAVDGGNSKNHLDSGVTGEVFESPEALAFGVIHLVRNRERHRRYFEAAQDRMPGPTEGWGRGAARVLEALARWVQA